MRLILLINTIKKNPPCRLDAKIKGVLAIHTVAMVTFFVMKIIMAEIEKAEIAERILNWPRPYKRVPDAVWRDFLAYL